MVRGLSAKPTRMATGTMVAPRCGNPWLEPNRMVVIPPVRVDLTTGWSVVYRRKGDRVMMTATKAVAGGVATNIVTLILWAISTIPGWERMPDEPQAAIIALVSSGVGAAIVYFAPANKQTLAETAPQSSRALGAPLGSGAVLAAVAE
jgi:hypothetical protein